MKNKRDSLMTVIGKLTKIFPLLGSDKSGEVVNAAGKIVHLLASAKLDLHDLVAFIRGDYPQTNNSNPLFEKEVDTLLRLGLDEASLFHTAEEAGYADIPVGGHHETWPIQSGRFYNWLLQLFYREKGKVPTGTAMNSAIRALNAHAFFDSAEEHEVHLRVAEVNGRIYLDLGDKDWQAIEIDENGWQIISNPPVKFRRTRRMRPFPSPERGGSIRQLRDFVNLNDDQFILLVAVILDGLRAGRPHPILYLGGEGGTAKSTLATIVQSLTDPTSIKPRNLPGGVRNLFVAANNQCVLNFDNISSITAAISDALCQISTGSGYGDRQLFSNGDEFIVGGSHLMILNGVNNTITRPDLADRTVVLRLARISKARQRSEGEFWEAFEAARPQIFGSLLDAAAHGLRELPHIRLQQMFRMADFQRWATASETAFAKRGSFQRAWERCTVETNEGLVEDDAVASAVAGFVMLEGHHHWVGTAVNLLAQLTDHDTTEGQVTKSRTWPRDPSIFARRLRWAAPILQKLGVEVEFARMLSQERTRTITLRLIEPNDCPQEAPRPANASADSSDGAHTAGGRGRVVRFLKK